MLVPIVADVVIGTGLLMLVKAKSIRNVMMHIALPILILVFVIGMVIFFMMVACLEMVIYVNVMTIVLRSRKLKFDILD